MNDPSTVAFTLTYAATLGVTAVMFLGQILAFAGLLALAGTAGFLIRIIQILGRPRLIPDVLALPIARLPRSGKRGMEKPGHGLVAGGGRVVPAA